MSGDFFSEEKTVEVRERVVSIRPLPVKKIAKAARIAAPFFALVAEVDGKGEGANFSPLDLLEHVDAVIELVSHATDLDIEFVGNLDAAELVMLARAVIEENADFFTRKLAPLLTQTLQSVTAKMAAGPQ